MGRFWTGYDWADVPQDKDEWFEDYERELDEQEQYGENWD